MMKYGIFSPTSGQLGLNGNARHKQAGTHRTDGTSTRNALYATTAYISHDQRGQCDRRHTAPAAKVRFPLLVPRCTCRSSVSFDFLLLFATIGTNVCTCSSPSAPKKSDGIPPPDLPQWEARWGVFVGLVPHTLDNLPFLGIRYPRGVKPVSQLIGGPSGMMPHGGCSDVLRNPCAFTLGDEPLASRVEHGPMQLRWITRLSGPESGPD